jgi:hypothetical protein
VLLFCSVVFVLEAGFRREKKKDSRCTEESAFVRACRSLFCAGEWEVKNKNKKKKGRVGF